MLLLFNAFACLVRDVLCSVAWFVLLRVLPVFVCFFVLIVFVRFACDA